MTKLDLITRRETKRVNELIALCDQHSHEIANLQARLAELEQAINETLEDEPDLPADLHVEDVIREYPSARFVALMGNLAEGFVVYGPFRAGEANAFVHRHHGGMVMVLNHPG